MGRQYKLHLRLQDPDALYNNRIYHNAASRGKKHIKPLPDTKIIHNQEQWAWLDPSGSRKNSQRKSASFLKK